MPSPDRPLPDHIPRPDYYTTGQAEAERRSDARETPPVLSEKAIQKMRAACKLGREILDAAHRIIRPGVTTDEIDRVVHEYTVDHGAYPAPLHYFDFPKSVCTSVNEVVCHGIPDMRELEEGDIVNVDVSAILDGYHSDLNETFVVGSVSSAKKALVKATHDSLMACIKECKPGVFYRDMGGIITKFVNAQGFQVDKTYCGHGIGAFFHCAPNIPHYAGNKAKFVMKPGHCFTIEPMINMGSWKDTHWPDGWTAVTKDGLPSAQFEHTLLVNESGVEILTARLPTSPPLWWEIDEGAAASGDPSPVTAKGVYLGIREVARRLFGTDDLNGRAIAVQGVGSVGGYTCELLAKAGAHLVITDIDQDALDTVAKKTGAKIVSPNDIYDVEADIFSPNALGAIINEKTLARLKVKGVAGGANNQLVVPEMGEFLRRKGILYAPDYVINGGGIINVAAEISGSYSRDWVEAKLSRLIVTLGEVLDEAIETSQPTNYVADRIARARIASARKTT